MPRELTGFELSAIEQDLYSVESQAHIKVLLAIARCRTAALGGHIDECIRCGQRATISYNSCRNRHCPKCQTGARERWLAAWRRKLLPSRYVHIVFTLPPQLASVALHSKKVIDDLITAMTPPDSYVRKLYPRGAATRRRRLGTLRVVKAKG